MSDSEYMISQLNALNKTMEQILAEKKKQTAIMVGLMEAVQAGNNIVLKNILVNGHDSFASLTFASEIKVKEKIDSAIMAFEVKP